MVTESKQKNKLRKRSTFGLIPVTRNLDKAFSSMRSLLLFLFQHDDIFMLSRCRGKNKIVQTVQNQQVKNGAENVIFLFSLSSLDLFVWLGKW